MDRSIPTTMSHGTMMDWDHSTTIRVMGLDIIVTALRIVTAIIITTRTVSIIANVTILAIADTATTVNSPIAFLLEFNSFV